ncbi:MAG: indole-3-glycerol phosphate synthase TrpC [Gemmatimonadales bacterium]
MATARGRADRLRPLARELERRAAEAPAPRSFGVPRPDGSVGVIAEVKRRSPSTGAIRSRLDAVEHARAYAAGGAVAVSVLTEEEHFGGSLEDLERVVEAVTLPVLRKDFILDELQLLEGRAARAAAVLLIARILPRGRLLTLVHEARSLGLGALVEVHTADELDAALSGGATIVGVNSRDLDRFTVDLAAAERLLASVPPQVVAVAESGLETRRDVERMAVAGADHVLVGTALARLADPVAAVRALTGVPRHARTGAS